MPNEKPACHDHPRQFVGRRISFDGPVGTPLAGRRLVGVVERAEYAGRTARGDIPDYTLTVRGASGSLLTVSLVESYATFPDEQIQTNFPRR